MAREKALPGLHDEVFGLMKTVGREVLDLGAGEGAWASRLNREGFRVSIADRDPVIMEAARREGLKAWPVDLNSEFSGRIDGRFDCITAIEVIEHLENPRHFLRQCRALLKADGTLILTTPNIECIPSRLRFLLTGQFRMFDRDPRFNDPTHITPIQTYMLEKMVDECGYRIAGHGFNVPSARSARAWVNPLLRVLEAVTRGNRGGDIHIYVLRPVGPSPVPA